MPPGPKNTSAKLIDFIRDEPTRKGERYYIGIEIAAAQLRVAALAIGTTPSPVGSRAFDRAGFYAVGHHPWRFEPERFGSDQYRISRDEADTVCAAVKEFLKRVDIKASDVARIRVGVIIAFNGHGKAIEVRLGSLETKLGAEFPEVDSIAVGNRTSAALEVEHDYGAGSQIQPCDPLLYVTVSKNINMDATRVDYSGVFASGIRHERVNRSLLEELGTEWLGDDYAIPEPWVCRVCGKDCLYGIASGQGILDRYLDEYSKARLAIPESPVAQIAHDPGTGRFAADRGAVEDVNGTTITSAAVFRATQDDDIAQRVVLQAGMAIGTAIFHWFIKSGVLVPAVIAVGGTVSVGTMEEYFEPLAQRLTIDGLLERTLRHLTEEDLPRLVVTRSRFAGYTGLLGLTVPPRA